MSKTFTLPETGKRIFRGDTIILEGTVSQEGVAVNLAGHSIWFTAKPQITDTDAAGSTIQKTVGSGIVVVDAANGEIRITLSPSDTAGINNDTTYQCDVQIKNTSTGEISTVARGTMVVERDVTQATS